MRTSKETAVCVLWNGEELVGTKTGREGRKEGGREREEGGKEGATDRRGFGILFGVPKILLYFQNIRRYTYPCSLDTS